MTNPSDSAPGIPLARHYNSGMSHGPLNAVQETPRADAVSDRELLGRFIRGRDEAAFTAIVGRYGGLVLGVCRRALYDAHAAEDAFQATFLVLARSAKKIRKRRSLAAWLHGVALRVSSRALAQQRRRRERQCEVPEMTADCLEEIGAMYEQQVLDEELQQLPEGYRGPLVLHYLQGLSNQQVASQLGLSVPAVEGRLKRGRQELRRRLVRRGVGAGVIVAAVEAARATAEAASLAPLVASTAKAAVAHAAGHVSTALISQEAAHLAGKELAMLATPKLASLFSVSAAALVGVGLVAGGAALPGHGGSPDVAGIPARRDVSSGPMDAFSPLFDATSSTTEFLAQAGDVVPGSGSTSGFGAGGVGLGAGSQPLDLKPRDERTAQIELALTAPTQLGFPGNPLQDVVDYISSKSHVPVRLDSSLKAEGVNPDEEVNLIVDGVTLESALELMLDDIGMRTGVRLDYVIQNQVLKIVTRTKADELQETRVYSLRGLSPDYASEDLARVIRHTIQPSSWGPDSGAAVAWGGFGGALGPEAGGEGEMGAAGYSGGGGGGGMPGGGFGGGGGGMSGGVAKAGGTASIEPLPNGLVITQSQRAHREITDLLRQLQRLAAESAQDGFGAPTDSGAGWMGEGGFMGGSGFGFGSGGFMGGGGGRRP